MPWQKSVTIFQSSRKKYWMCPICQHSEEQKVNTMHKATHSKMQGSSGVPGGGGGFRVFKPLPEIPKALQKIVPNSTRLWKLLKKLLNLGRQHTKMFGKKGSKILKLPRFAIVLH